VLLASCSIDVGELQEDKSGAGGSNVAASAARGGAGSGAAGTPLAPSGGAGAAGSPPTRPPDAGSGGAGASAGSGGSGGEDNPRRTCGVVGLPCCNPGNICDLGACLRGKCTPYGGFYARSSDCSVDPCSSRNAYTAGCSCPFGFDDTILWHGESDCENTGSVSTEVRSCTSDRTPEMGFGGVWVKEPIGASCSVSCTAPNPATSRCGCPSGSSEFAIEGASGVVNCGDANMTFALCMNPNGMPLNFGGAYALSATAPDGCAAPNPFTGGCTCPQADAVPAPQNLHVGGYSIFICNL
jgi:hypothetical protein